MRFLIPLAFAQIQQCMVYIWLELGFLLQQKQERWTVHKALRGIEGGEDLMNQCPVLSWKVTPCWASCVWMMPAAPAGKAPGILLLAERERHPFRHAKESKCRISRVGWEGAAVHSGTLDLVNAAPKEREAVILEIAEFYFCLCQQPVNMPHWKNGCWEHILTLLPAPQPHTFCCNNKCGNVSRVGSMLLGWSDWKV